jgi:hypothetical protein
MIRLRHSGFGVTGALLLLAFVAAPLAAATLPPDSSSAQSLRLPRGARAVGLGEAYTALASGSESLAWNPAGLDNIRALQASASHMAYVQGIGVDTLQVALPIYGTGAWGVGLDYLYATDQGYDNWGNPTGDFSDFDFSAQIAMSFELPADMHLGGTYKIIREGYGSQFAMGSGFDFGWQWKNLFDHLDLGLVVQNLGTPIALGQGYGFLPITWRGGGALHLTQAWLISADFDHQAIDFYNKGHFGTEYSLPIGDFTAALRGGYSITPAQALGGLTGLAVGGGLTYGRFQVDYAWQPMGDLGDTHRVSLTYSSWQ